MNVSVRLTLDGMIRALRWQAHRLAEDAARGYAGDGGEQAVPTRLSARSPLRREENDDDRAGE